MIGSILSVATICCLFGDLFAEQSDIVSLEEIKVISATGFEQNLIDAPASISVITKEDLEKKSYQSINDILRDVSGVFINSSGGQFADVYIRGMDGGFTLFLIDGKPLTGKEAADKWFKNGLSQKSMPPVDMIERIEIIKGPMSSLYGSEAMGGVINIITKKITNDWHGSINTSYTIQKNKDFGDYWDTEIYLAGPLVQDILGIQISGLLNQKKEDNTNVSGMPEAKDKDVGGKLTWKINDENELSLDYKHVNENSTETKEDEDDRGMKVDYKKDTIVLSHAGQYDKLSLDSYFMHDNSKHHSSAWEGSHDQDNEFKTYLFNSQGAYIFDTNILTLGLQYKSEELKTWDQGTTAKYKRWDVSFFGEDNYFVTNDLTLTLGARLNKNENYGTHFTPRIYANYHINDNFTLKGGVSTGYKNPGLIASAKDSMMLSGGNRGANLGNPDLKPETSINYEAGFAYNNENIDFSLIAFHSDFKDKIEYTVICSHGDASEPSTWTCETRGRKFYLLRKQMNIGKSEINGAELAFGYSILPNLKLNANYTFTKSKQKNGEDKGKPLNILPKHMANIGLDYGILSNLNLWTQIAYQGKEPDVEYDWGVSKGQKAYGIVDLGGVYRLNKNARISAGIYNVLNKKLFDEDDNQLSMNGARASLGFSVSF